MIHDDGVVVKVLKSDNKVIQETAGINAFRPFVIVPSITKIDTKTVELSLLSGARADAISVREIEKQTLNLFRKIQAIPSTNRDFSVIEKIETFRQVFAQFSDIQKVLGEIEYALTFVSQYPVHGDLQKQNMFLIGQELGLIDFEHFIVAPQELELANSFFFNDHNCLPVARITPVLIEEKIIQKEMLSLMIYFYAIHQLNEGRKRSDVERKYNRALQRLRALCGNVKTYQLNFKKKYSYSPWYSTCFT